MNKTRKSQHRRQSLEIMRIMRSQELERQLGKVIPIPEFVIEAVRESRRRMEAGIGTTIPLSGLDDWLGIIRYGKRGKDYYKPRRNERKTLH